MFFSQDDIMSTVEEMDRKCDFRVSVQDLGLHLTPIKTNTILLQKMIFNFTRMVIRINSLIRILHCLTLDMTATTR